MSTHRRIEAICIAAAILGVLIMGLFCLSDRVGIKVNAETAGYEQTLFDTSRVHTVDIVMDDWDGFLETCEDESYASCALVIDNESCKNVAIRGKGNTSLSSVRRYGNNRYSFKIEFDHYEAGKSYHGLDKLCLNNLIQDNTMMKDYLAYRMMDGFGVNAPLCSFVYLTVNGEDWGLYLAVEGVEDSFLERCFGSGRGNLYKPDSMGFGGGKGNGREFDMDSFRERMQQDETSAPMNPNGEFPGQPSQMQRGERERPGAGMGANGAEDVKLQYIDDDPDSYPNIFDNAKTEIGKKDKTRLISSLKKLSEQKDLETVLDTDAVMRYFVVHNFTVNGDSYTGGMIHNYYLHEKEGKLSMLPWDYNLAFGTFQGNRAADAVNDAIDEVLTDRPMQSWIFSSDQYKERYFDLYRNFLSTVDPDAIISEAYEIIKPYVEKDPTKFCTSAEFEAGVSALRRFCELRRQSVGEQLEGTGTQIDAGDLKLLDMGSMGQEGGPGADGGRPQQMPENMPEGMPEIPEGEQMQPPDGERIKNPQMQTKERTQPSLREQTPEAIPGSDDEKTTQKDKKLILLAVSIAVLAGGLITAIKFKA